MLVEAAAAYDIDLTRSFMVGDRWSDIAAGRAAGCETFLIDRPYSQRAALQSGPVAICRSIAWSDRGKHRILRRLDRTSKPRSHSPHDA